MARHRRQVDNTGAEDDRQTAARECPQQRAHAADAGVCSGLVGSHEHHLGELTVSDVGGRHQRQAVAARTIDEVIRPPVCERIQQRPAVAARRAGLEHLLDDRLAVLRHAQVKGDGSRVDAGYTEHIIRQ
jgi:hypothetical protein